MNISGRNGRKDIQAKQASLLPGALNRNDRLGLSHLTSDGPTVLALPPTPR